jgi:uncharacterized protein YkwD
VLVRLRVSRVCALATAVLCTFVPAASAACDGADSVPAPGTTGAQLLPFVDATTCVVNEVRTAAGLAPLKLDGRLTVAAYWHGADMTTKHFFSHAGSDGRHAAARAITQGYGKDAESWVVGETLGWGEGTLATPRAIVVAWLASPEHRPVVMNPVFRDVGIMVLPAAPDASSVNGITYVADFGVEEFAELEEIDPDSIEKAQKSVKACKKLPARRRARCVKITRRAVRAARAEIAAAREAQAAARE